MVMLQLLIFLLPLRLLLPLLWPMFFSAVGVAWPPAVSVVSCVPAAAVVLTAVDVPGVPAVARASAVVATVPIAVYVLSATGVSNIPGVPAVFGFPGVVGFPAVVVFPAVAGVLAR
jgi:hypothetical protein